MGHQAQKKNIQSVYVGLLIKCKMKWPLTTEKPENFSADKENRQGYVQAYLLTEKYVPICYPQHLLRILYKCVSAISATSALASFHFGECLLFYPSCLLYGKDFFQTFCSMANKRYKWYVTKSVCAAITIFFFWMDMDVHISCKVNTVRKHNAMARSAFKKIPQQTFY